jgi:hypothetical protein
MELVNGPGHPTMRLASQDTRILAEKTRTTIDAGLIQKQKRGPPFILILQMFNLFIFQQLS